MRVCQAWLVAGELLKAPVPFAHVLGALAAGTCGLPHIPCRLNAWAYGSHPGPPVNPSEASRQAQRPLRRHQEITDFFGDPNEQILRSPKDLIQDTELIMVQRPLNHCVALFVEQQKSLGHEAGDHLRV